MVLARSAGFVATHWLVIWTPTEPKLEFVADEELATAAGPPSWALASSGGIAGDPATAAVIKIRRKAVARGKCPKTRIFPLRLGHFRRAFNPIFFTFPISGLS
jgi:hypothetical protein